MMQLRKAIISVLLLVAAMGAFAQSAQGGAPAVVLAYFDDASQITVTNSAGMAYQGLSFGMTLGAGDKVVTQNSSAELQMEPNGTIIKLAPNTQFTVDSIQGSGSATTNQFSLLGGRLRTIAAKVAGASYEVRTNTAIGGVRGTDFGMEVIPGQSDSLFVKEGTVAFTKIASGESLTLNAGDFADALANTFQVVKLSTDQLNNLFNSLNFEKLDPTQVPGHQVTQPQSGSSDNAPANPPPAVPPTPSTESTASSGPSQPGPLDKAMEFMAQYLGMQIGGVTIDGVTYSKMVLQPQFTIGKLKTALYLPIIYSSNLFDPTDWYHPAGNNEWSFGFDQTDILHGIGDFVSDLFLKIRFIEYGDQRDPFFFKVGNLHDMTLGHGVIVNNFANDSDFPAVRRVGVNLGLDANYVGIEALVNDIANPQIFGTRFYFRPFAKSFKLAFGFSGVADIAPASALQDSSTLDPSTPNLDAITAAETADPLFLNVGSDVDLPIVESDPFAIILFGDIAGLLPYVRNATTLTGGKQLNQGFQFQALVDTSGSGFPLRNYGIASGVFGNIFGLNYRLEYRNYNGIFRPAFYDSTYERLRGTYAADLMSYFADPTAAQYQNVTMGIYGEAGFTILKALSFEAGYMWPWTWDSGGNIEFGTDDYLKLKIDVQKGLIPLGISGSISYERTKFVPTLLNDPSKYGQLSLFDANTVLSGEIIYPIAPTMNIALAVSTIAKHDDNGAVVFDANGNPVIVPTISIETRIGY